VSDRMSHATVTSAPVSWAAAISGPRSRSTPDIPGFWMTTPVTSAAGFHSSVMGSTRASMPRASACAKATSSVWGKHSSSRTTAPPCLAARCINSTASPTAVASSSKDAFANGNAVRSDTIVWKLSIASRRPCEISAWYGV